MKILFVIDSLRFGGAERQLVELVKGLRKPNNEIHLICLDDYNGGYTDILTELGIRIHCFCRSHKYDVWPVFLISRYIRQNRIDIVHSFMTLSGLAGVPAAKLSGRPVVCSAVRDGKYKSFKEKIFQNMLSRLSDIFVANSRAGFANRFIRMKDHFRVVYNGVDFSRFEEEKISASTLKKDLNTAGFQNIVGMIASFSIHKDHETLLKAVPMVLKIFPETCLLLIGDGSERKKTEKHAMNLGLQKNVLFLGCRKDVDRVYPILDLAVLLTNSDAHLEGISNAIIEAMAVGIPVIASKGGGTDEIVGNNLNGILVEPKNPRETAEAIIELLTDRKKAKRLAMSAKTSVREMFGLKRYVDEYEHIYRELLPS
jgi:glycosyltransferase involved in cell wall biosynthesis